MKEEMKAVLIEFETMPTSCRGKTQENRRTEIALLFVMVKLRLSM